MNSFGQLGDGTFNSRTLPARISLSNVDFIESGGNHIICSCEGQLYAFGNNCYGQLGLGDIKNREIPTKIDLKYSGDIISIALGMDHSVFLLDNDEVYTFGFNSNGQLGLGHTDKKVFPVK